jgi:hypothetical protein
MVELNRLYTNALLEGIFVSFRNLSPRSNEACEKGSHSLKNIGQFLDAYGRLNLISN